MTSKNKKKPEKRYVVFKPRISIGNIDEQQTEFIFKALGIEHTKPKNRKIGDVRTNIIAIQNFKDVKMVIEILEKYRFTSVRKQKSFDAFRVCYDNLEENGYIFTEWQDKFEDFIKMKLMINQERGNIEKKRISADEWKSRITEHLNSS